MFLEAFLIWFVLPGPAIAIHEVGKAETLKTFAFPNTGLSLSRSGVWAIGNDGRSSEIDTSFQPTIELLDADLNLMRRIEISLLIARPSSLQGVAFSSSGNEIWFAMTAMNAIASLSIDGQLNRVIPLSFFPNGLAYDPAANALVVGKASSERRSNEVVWINPADGGELRRLPLTHTPDHLAIHGGYLWFTFGRNRTAGQIRAVDIATGETAIALSVPAADAIEGVVVSDEYVYLNSDSQFHRGEPPTNRIIALPRSQFTGGTAPP